jgi:hypothetical protein
MKLPLDVLVHVFSLCCPSVDNHRQNPRFLAYSQTCQLWRDVSLSNPLLWTFPLFNWPGVARMMLHRARNLPIPVIRARLSERNMPLVIEILQAHTGPRELIVSGRACFLRQIFTLNVKVPSLRLIQAKQAPRGSADSASFVPSFTCVLFTCPQLTSLTLWNCFPVTKGIAATTSLTRLCLVSHSDSGTDVSNLFNLLHRAPLLQYLELDGMVHSVEFGSSTRVPLLHMQHITVANVEPDQASAFIMLLELPKCNVHVKAVWPHHTQLVPHEFFKSLRKIMGSRARVLRLTVHPTLFITLKTADAHDKDANSYTFNFRASSSPDINLLCYLRSVYEPLGMINLAHLEELEVRRKRYKSGLAGEGVHLVLTESPFVRRVIAHEEAANDIYQTLHYYSRHRPAWDQLGHISFHSAMFHGVRPEMYDKRTALELWTETLSQRQKEGHSIRMRMCFLKCAVIDNEGARRSLLHQDLEPLQDYAEVEIRQV